MSDFTHFIIKSLRFFKNPSQDLHFYTKSPFCQSNYQIKSLLRQSIVSQFLLRRKNSMQYLSRNLKIPCKNLVILFGFLDEQLNNMRCDEMFTLSQMVVGYHFCQLDNSITCYVPEFVHSLAAQLYQAPQMEAYRQQLISESHLQVIISFELYYHYTICPLCELLHCMHIYARALPI
jgi:hypothetical protein